MPDGCRRLLLCPLAVAMFAACTPGSEPARPGAGATTRAELHGRRAIALRDGDRVWWFDAEARPRIRVSRAAGLSVHWVADDGGEHTMHHNVGRVGDMTFLSTTGNAPLGPGRLQLRSAGHPVAQWPAEWQRSPARHPPIERLIALREAVDVAPSDAALRARNRTTADAVLDQPHAQDLQLWLSAEAARRHIAYAGPDDTTASERAEAAWVDAAGVAAEMGVPSETVRRLCAAAHMAVRRAAFDEAAGHLERARGVVDPDAMAQALIAHAAGVLADRTGKWQAAEAYFGVGADAAARAGAHRMRGFLRESQAILASRLGHHGQAIALIEPLVDDETLDDQSRRRAAINAGYMLFRAMARGALVRDFPRVRSLYARAERLGSRADSAAHLHVNRALVELLDGRIDAAAAHVERVERAGEGTEVAAIVSVVHGRIAQAHGRWQAADAYYRSAERAAVRWWGADGGDYGWRADLGLGQVAHARGDRVSAAGHFDRARGRLERLSTFTDPLAHRVAFFADRNELARSALTVALERGDLEGAFTAIDRNQGRVLRSMLWAVLGSRAETDEARRWSALKTRIAEAAETVKSLETKAEGVSGEALRALKTKLGRARVTVRRRVDAAAGFLDDRLPQTRIEPAQVRAALASDETILAVGRHDGGRVAVWAHADGYGQTPLPELIDDAGLPEPPWPTGHLFVVAGGHPDVVRAAFRTAVDRSYPVSLLPVAELLVAPRRRPSKPPAVLADPTGELPEARAEGHWLAGVMPGAELHAVDKATRAALRDALGAADLVHFSGHGELSLDRPWTSHLVLAGGERFDVFDVLSTTAGGGLAVLNGCETGADALSTRDDVLGLPEALLVAGAAAVVAADRTLPDADARRFSELFYMHGGHRQPGPALQATMRALRDDGIPTWDAWRLVGRPVVGGRATREDRP